MGTMRQTKSKTRREKDNVKSYGAGGRVNGGRGRRKRGAKLTPDKAPRGEGHSKEKTNKVPRLGAKGRKNMQDKRWWINTRNNQKCN